MDFRYYRQLRNEHTCRYMCRSVCMWWVQFYYARQHVKAYFHYDCVNTK